ncbi:lariat debranching enzyme, C-terminal domain-containing protein [Cantharellus anzutake]|uniref:lariat debranching enzyme, C-terminal domain-containing protein n=1 Tax=Cantharellus anzutake TaxID=1750568 RepID=UPI0019058C71|nr:lariat debranching enzyme, C-terminal domain-containing protein [Cantharellus anzutake]KAF8337498.1 lariat debranching enzyme, C-terminal domain-containing protein [Cantharellus anzutake]
MKIAVEGCCHGELDATYKQITYLQMKDNYNIDLLLINGDFQAIRNNADLACMAVPDKYRRLGGFYKYYTGEKVAPVLTIIIGGNHEASNYLWELYHGGWLAPNIYYLGCAGVVNLNGIRIAGISGIYNYHSYSLGHFEKLPYDKSTLRSIYHVRHYDVFRILQLSPPDIFLSHDWPKSIEHHGDLASLLSQKPFFRPDVESGKLGSPPLATILEKLRPKWWFSAHLHVKYEATYRHGGNTTSAESPLLPRGATKNPDEITIDDDEFDDEQPSALVDTSENVTAPELSSELPSSSEEPAGSAETKFLALDKCLPKRQYLEVIDIPSPFDDTPVASGPATSADINDPSTSSLESLLPTSFTGRQAKTSSPPPPSSALDPKLHLTYDTEWLAITRALHPYLSLSRLQDPLPSMEEARKMVQKELEWIKENVGEGKKIENVQKFCMTAPGPKKVDGKQPIRYINPQTIAFCSALDIENKL